MFIYMIITVFVDNLDCFEDKFCIAIPTADRAAAITTAADLLAAKSTALVWEAVLCAAPEISGVQVKISADCVSHTAVYTNAVTPARTNYTGWSPDLHDLVAEKSRTVNADLTAMFTDLAAAHFDGAAIEGGSRYVIRPRH